MQSAILWYDTFKGCLEDMGFKVNKYDPCVANKTINGKQCTICWYVDDTKISHVDAEVVSMVIRKIYERFGKMVVTRGKVHNFVGMDVTFQDNGTLKMIIKDYITECFEAFGEPINKGATTPGKHHLFDVVKSTPLSDEKMEVFHQIVAKLLYM